MYRSPFRRIPSLEFQHHPFGTTFFGSGTWVHLQQPIQVIVGLVLQVFRRWRLLAARWPLVLSFSRPGAGLCGAAPEALDSQGQTPKLRSKGAANTPPL